MSKSAQENKKYLSMELAPLHNRSHVRTHRMQFLKIHKKNKKVLSIYVLGAYSMEV